MIFNLFLVSISICIGIVARRQAASLAGIALHLTTEFEYRTSFVLQNANNNYN